jgi:hypothetical protein
MKALRLAKSISYAPVLLPTASMSTTSGQLSFLLLFEVQAKGTPLARASAVEKQKAK